MQDTKTPQQTIDEIMHEMGIHIDISDEQIIKFLANNPKMAIDYLESLLIKQSHKGNWMAVQAIEYFQRKQERMDDEDEDIGETVIEEKGVDITITRKSNVWLTLLTYLLILSGGLLLGYQLKADYVNAYHSNPSKILPMNLK